ncbi:MAG: hypothetical protein ACW99A_22485, partial [Candidatus Kariarchaeaceae archaeon]
YLNAHLVVGSLIITRGGIMVNIAGYEVDFLSLAPAVLALLLSIYNWFKMSRPANLYPNEIINYGYIASDYQGGVQLCIPLILHNEGANRGMITGVKIGFQFDNEIKYIDVLGKARLNEVDINQAFRFDWDKFEQDGYRMIQPTYPIIVEGLESTDVTLIAQATFKENVIPIDTQTECIVEIKFGKNKSNLIKFPFFLSKEFAEVDNRLMWYEPIQK